MSFLKRIWLAIVLVVLGPITAEYLVDSLPLLVVGKIIFFVGGVCGFGAFLVREIARQTGGGWPTIALGSVYRVLNRGIGDLTLFNPSLYGMRLLDYGFMPEVGIARIFERHLRVGRAPHPARG